MAASPVPSRLVTSGLVELAAGALSGWVYTLAREEPERARAVGIKSSTRVRQWHLDLIMMGTATVAIGAAAPDAPRLAQAALGVGAWTNAMSFLPLAFAPEVDDHPAYKAFCTASFVTTTVGFVGIAASAVRARRRTRTA